MFGKFRREMVSCSELGKDAFGQWIRVWDCNIFNHSDKRGKREQEMKLIIKLLSKQGMIVIYKWKKELN